MQLTFNPNDLLKIFKIQNTKNGLVAYEQNCYGYGDIIRSVAHASKLQNLCGKKIKVIFIIPDPNIPFFIDIDKLLSYFYIDVDYEIRYESLFPYKGKLCNFTKYEYYSSQNLFNFFIDWDLKPKDFDSKIEQDYICVWLPYDNLTPYQQLKFNKFNFDEQSILSVFKNLKMSAKFISYRSDIDYFMQTIKNAKYCIGYDGPGQVIAHAYKKKTATMINSHVIKRYNGVGVHKIVCPSILKLVTNIDELKDILNEWNY